MNNLNRHIAEAIIELLRRRAEGASICPSEAARLLDATNWRPFMPAVRFAAAELARSGVLRITRGAQPQHPDALYAGPIRLRRGPRWPG